MRDELKAADVVPVSIHAPWEGCDEFPSEFPNSTHLFQFTHPGKGATHTFFRLLSVTSEFQFTHPGKGATAGRCNFLALLLCFNSRTLGRVRRTCTSIHGLTTTVSIHAPWEGCDLSACANLSTESVFQFTHPGKGATVWCKVAYYRADKQA